MLDPASIGIAITAANTAFNAIKKGFAAGREIESMGKDLSRWMGAVSDVENTEKTAKNASPLRKLFKGREIEASAIEAFTAKKKLEAQRQELKSFINFHYGANSWNEILRMEAEIRKKRKEEIYERQELIRKIWEYVGWFVLFCTVVPPRCWFPPDTPGGVGGRWQGGPSSPSSRPESNTCICPPAHHDRNRTLRTVPYEP